MATDSKPDHLVGKTMFDSNGNKVGEIKDVYFDKGSSRAEWALVETGWFEKQQTFVPLMGHATDNDGDIKVDWKESVIKDAPTIGPDGDISGTEESALCAHYGLAYSPSDAGANGLARFGRVQGGST